MQSFVRCWDISSASPILFSALLTFKSRQILLFFHNRCISQSLYGTRYLKLTVKMFSFMKGFFFAHQNSVNVLAAKSSWSLEFPGCVSAGQRNNDMLFKYNVIWYKIMRKYMYKPFSYSLWSPLTKVNVQNVQFPKGSLSAHQNSLNVLAAK